MLVLAVIAVDSAVAAAITPVWNGFAAIPLMGDILAYEDLTITFIVDENLENYIEMHTWLTAIGFPENTKQFSDFFFWI